MRPQIEDLLARARRAHHELDDADAEERVLHSVKSAIALGIGPTVSVPVSFERASWFSHVKTWLVSTSTKLGILAAGTGALVGAGDSVFTSEIAHRVAPATLAAGPKAPPKPLPPVVSPPEIPFVSTPSPASGGSSTSVHGAPTRKVPLRERAPAQRLNKAAPASMTAELAQLRRAQEALRRGDGQEALRELETGLDSETRLDGERQVARILALCALGRVKEARSAAAAFSRAYPQSIHRDTIARSCANEGRIHED